MTRLPFPRVRRLAGRCSILLIAGAAICQAQNRGDPFASDSGNDSFRSPQAFPRAALFFPPYPPALDRVITRGASPGDPRLPVAPPELAAHVNEIFYPMLGSRLHRDALKEPLRRQLDAYRAAKLALQNELRAELARVRNAEPATRLQALTTLARAQAPRLAQLETAAEQLRRDLLQNDYTWNTLREWRLGNNDRRGDSPLEIAHVMRAYVYYQHHLLPAQRRLLREIAIELLLSADDATKATANQPHIFFPPEPARVLFPEHLSAEAAAKLASYQTKKSHLKKELYDAIYKHDGQSFGFLTGNTPSALAAKQSARLAELETLAEEIRRLLPPSHEIAARAARSPLPVALTERVEKMMQTYAAVQKDASARIDAIVEKAKSLPFQSNYRFEADGLKFLVVPTRSARGDPAALRRIADVRAEINVVAEDYGHRLTELVNERDAIRTEAAAALGNAQPDAVESAIMSTMRAIHQRNNAAHYDEYRVAVFEPGLSPEQRRVLFDSVIERLELPLPRAELQPTRRANSW